MENGLPGQRGHTDEVTGNKIRSWRRLEDLAEAEEEEENGDEGDGGKRDGEREEMIKIGREEDEEMR